MKIKLGEVVIVKKRYKKQEKRTYAKAKTCKKFILYKILLMCVFFYSTYINCLRAFIKETAKINGYIISKGVI